MGALKAWALLYLFCVCFIWIVSVTINCAEYDYLGREHDYETTKKDLHLFSREFGLLHLQVEFLKTNLSREENDKDAWYECN